MTPTPPSDFSISFSEVEWFRFMTSDKRGPNVLVSCSNSGVGPVVARLMSVCPRPVHNRHLPGPLNLREVTSGTLLLWDVALLTLDQQMELHEWMTARRQDVQIISVTAARLADLAESRQFYEGLFYRLNVITLHAIVGESRGEGRPDRRPYGALPPGLDRPPPVRQSIGV